MKAPKEHKPQQSRRINTDSAIRNNKVVATNLGNNVNKIAKAKDNHCVTIQREPIYLNNYAPYHTYKIGFSTFTSHSRSTHSIIGNMMKTEMKGFPVLWAGHTMLSSQLDSRFRDRIKDDVRAKGFWTKSGGLWDSIMSSINFLWHKSETGLLNNDTALLNHPEVKTIYVYVSRNVFNEWRRIQGPQNGIYTHSPDIDSENTHNCVSFALNKAWRFTMTMLEDQTLDAHDKDAMLKLNEFVESAVITLREELAQPDNSSKLNPGLQGNFLKFIQENYKNPNKDSWGITDDDITMDLFGHNDDYAL